MQDFDLTKCNATYFVIYTTDNSRIYNIGWCIIFGRKQYGSEGAIEHITLINSILSRTYAQFVFTYLTFSLETLVRSKEPEMSKMIKQQGTSEYLQILCRFVFWYFRCFPSLLLELRRWRMAGEVVVDALPYYDQGYDEPGVREAVSLERLAVLEQRCSFYRPSRVYRRNCSFFS